MRLWPIRSRRRNQELDEELQTHLALAARDLEERGLSPKEAAQSARREFGNERVVREATRDVWGGSLIEEIGQDIHYGLRGLRRNPGFTLTALVSLAIGIGANTAIFSLTDATLNRPLPFPEPDRLVALSEESVTKGIKGGGASPGNLLDWRQAKDAFSGLTGFYAHSVVVTEEQNSEVVIGASVSADFFEVFGLAPILGRVFTPEEMEAGVHETANGPVPGPVVISHRLWLRRFGGSRAMLGQTISLDGAVRHIVGVMPSSFAAANADIDLWLPWDIARAYARLKAIPRDWRFVRVVGRLNPGMTLPAAQGRAAAVAASIALSHPGTNAGWSVAVTPLKDSLVGGSRSTLLALFAAVGLVLLLTAANVANLQIARGAAREREMAVRLALGVAKGRLVRQLLTESLLLATLGGLLGVALAAFLVRYLLVLVPKSMATLDQVSIDGRVLLFALLLTMSVGVASGLLPAWRTSSLGLAAVFRGGSRLGGGMKLGARRFLVAAQVAIALVLVASALLLTQSVVSLRQVDPGFQVENRVIARVSLNTTKYSSNTKRIAYFDELAEALGALPGVASVGATTVLPMSEGATDFNRPYWREDRPRPEGAPTPVDVRMVLPRYLDAMGMRVLSGRGINDHDQGNGPPVVMINERLARVSWPGENPVGKRIILDYRGGPYPYEIVGVVNDTRYYGLRSEARPEVFIPYRQNPYPALFLVIHGGGDPAGLIAAVRRVMIGIDPTQPAQTMIALPDLVMGTLGRERLATGLFGAMAGIALLLSALGIWGIIEYAVSQTTRDIGLKMALGARTRAVLIDVLRQAAQPVALGLLIGVAALWPLTWWMQSLLFGISPHDPKTIALSSVLLLLVALVAAAGPSSRAIRIDPSIALRTD